MNLLKDIGAVIGALFLRRFVKRARRFAHFDIYAWRQAQQCKKHLHIILLVPWYLQEIAQMPILRMRQVHLQRVGNRSRILT